LNKRKLLDLIASYPCVFWDFDGVIKESIEAKTDAFKQIFSKSSEEVLDKIVLHHQENGGMSRYEKIPIYLEWSEIEYNNHSFETYCNKFSKIAKSLVVNSPWVDGAFNFIQKRHESGLTNIVVTATPQKEIEEIVSKLQINKLFDGVYGSPKSKTDLIKFAFVEMDIDSEKSIMIGDSMTDYIASQESNIDFILRETEFNSKLRNLCGANTISNFIYE